MTDSDDEEQRRVQDWYRRFQAERVEEEARQVREKERLAEEKRREERQREWELRNLEEEKYPFLKEERLAKAAERVEPERQSLALEMVKRLENALSQQPNSFQSFLGCLIALAIALALAVAGIVFLVWLNYK
jgi:hypothetical protein